MNAAGYVLALIFVEGLPLPHRAAWVAWLRSFEPRPVDLRLAAQILHLNGFLRHDRLTPKGVRAALEAVHEALTPPSLNGGET